MILLFSIGKALLKIVYALLKLLPVQNKITFISRQSDEPSLDFEMLKKDIVDAHPDCKVVMLCKMLNKSVAGAAGYVFHMFRQMYHIATSKAVILDSYCIVISVLKHRESLIVIQMWHSVGTMKKFGWSIVDEPEGSSRKIAELMSMHRGYSYALASSDAYKSHLASGFDFPEEKIVTLPLPRVEALQDNEFMEGTKKKIYAKYPELEGGARKNIVYVPTFRKNGGEEEREAVIKLIKSVDYDRFRLIVKLHPLTEKALKEGVESDGEIKKLIEQGKLIIDDHFSSMDMLFISDAVISDFSCIIYEAAVINRPLYFYAYDYDDYALKRDMYMNYEKEVPGPVVKDPEELMQVISGDFFAEDGERAQGYDMGKLKAFREKYVKITGHETRDITDFIFGKIK